MQLKSINNLIVLCSLDPMHLSKTFAAASWFIQAASNSGCQSSGPPDDLEGSSTPSSMWEQQWKLQHQFNTLPLKRLTGMGEGQVL